MDRNGGYKCRMQVSEMYLLMMKNMKKKEEGFKAEASLSNRRSTCIAWKVRWVQSSEVSVESEFGG